MEGEKEREREKDTKCKLKARMRQSIVQFAALQCMVKGERAEREGYFTIPDVG